MSSESQPNDFTNTPVIIMGANHTGTRVLVDLLTILGSDDGKADNGYREDKLFLSIHKDLISRVSKDGWDETIFSLQFVRRFKDTGKYVEVVRRDLARYLDSHFPNRSDGPWHWKCPTAMLFAVTWRCVFPDAYYIHLTRNTASMGESFLRRRQILWPLHIAAFQEAMDNRMSYFEGSHLLSVHYENLIDDLDRLIAFLPFEPDEEVRVKAKKYLLCVASNRRYATLSFKPKFRNFLIKVYLWPFRFWWFLRGLGLQG